MEWIEAATMSEDDIFARPPRRSTPPPAPQTCAVCGLRSHGLVCAMCLDTPAASITWLEKLPSLSLKEQQALVELKARQGPQALTFTGIPLDYWREEVRLECAVSLARLRRIVDERGADFDRTIAGLKGV